MVFHFIKILILFFPLCIYSQSYIKVSSTSHFTSNEEGKFNNVYIYNFKPNLYDYFEYKYCKISFYVYDQNNYVLPDEHIIRAVTGYDQNYIEDEETSDSLGYVEIDISTNNLEKLNIGVCYNGYNREFFLFDVNFKYYHKKY